MLNYLRSLYLEKCKKQVQGEQKEKNHARHYEFGKTGEEIAKLYLEKKGYEVLCQNWRCHPYELDIICRYQDVLVFIEVKTRTEKWDDQGLEGAIHALTQKKKQSLLKAAIRYLSENHAWGKASRFDFVCVIFAKGQVKHVEHIENVIEFHEASLRGKSGKSKGGGHSSWQPW